LSPLEGAWKLEVDFSKICVSLTLVLFKKGEWSLAQW